MRKTMQSILVFLLIIGVLQIDSQTISKGRCRISNKRCSCDIYGNNLEYRYPNINECEKALRGKRSDSCTPNPCLNNGNCLQISTHPGFRCRCEGTGYFGATCSRRCPEPNGTGSIIKIFPYECIVI